MDLSLSAAGNGLCCPVLILDPKIHQKYRQDKQSIHGKNSRAGKLYSSCTSITILWNEMHAEGLMSYTQFEHLYSSLYTDI